MTVRVRFAPSPTGEPHIGNVRTVLFGWLFARHMGGKFILRIEDTDRTRYQPETIPVIMEGMRWLGLDWDEGPSVEELRRAGVAQAERYGVGGPYGPYIQSERLALYKQVAEELVARGWAYRCNCPPKRLERLRAEQHARKEPLGYDRHCRDKPADAISPDEPHVIRLKVPLTGQTILRDAIRGEIAFDNAGIDDQVLLKSDGFPTYHLAVVVDDHYMQISHVTRGDDWISSSPKRLLIYQAMGWEPPIFVHVPLVTASDGRKLSKRHGATSITEFRERGYLPEALFNFLALLGWAPGEGEEREIFRREELIERFDLFRINRAAAAFSYEKLDWMNGVYIRSLPTDDLLERLIPLWQRAGYVPTPCPDEMRPMLRRIVPLIQERLKHLTDVIEWTDLFFIEPEPPSAEALRGRLDAAEALSVLRQARQRLAALEDFGEETIETTLRALAEESGLKTRDFFALLRLATTYKQVSPPLFSTLSILGQERVLARMQAAERVLSAPSPP